MICVVTIDANFVFAILLVCEMIVFTILLVCEMVACHLDMYSVNTCFCYHLFVSVCDTHIVRFHLSVEAYVCFVWTA